MQKRVNVLLPVTLFFLIICIFFLSGGSIVFKTVSSLGFEQVGTFLQSASFNLFSSIFSGNSKKVDEESGNAFSLAKNGAEQQEIKALRDQFETSSIPTTFLIPARIIGFEGFIPGISRPTEIILDKGVQDGIQIGLAVIYRNNLVGKVSKATATRSQISLLTKSGWSFTAKSSDGKTNGLVEVDGGDIFLKNVVLSDVLSKKDLVVTKGDVNIKGGGFPPDIVVGEVSSIDKKASALFQVAKIKSFVDVVSLTIVFVYKQ